MSDMPWVDTHCHLDAPEFDADRDDVVQVSRAAGVGCVVLPAVFRDNFDTVLGLAERLPEVVPALGMHPIYADSHHQDDHLAVLDDYLTRFRPRAVGEIGLDYFVPGLSADRQEYFFVEQLKLARKHGLPVLLHVRRSQDVLLKWLRRIPVPGGFAHAFNGSRQQADEFIKLGFKLGFGGAMTFPRALRIRELAATLPLDSLVLETDAPDIPPEWDHKGRNTPAYLPRIGAVLAELRGMPVEAVAEATRRNAEAVLGRLPA